MEDKPLLFATEEAPPFGIKKELPKIEYEIKGENNIILSLSIVKDDINIIFVVKENEDIFILYKRALSLQDFYNSNRIFRQYISIDELFNLYLKKLKTSEIIISKSENKIKLVFLIEFHGEKDEIPFVLEPSQLKTEDAIKILCENEKTNNAKIKKLENKLIEKDKIICELIKKVDTIEKNYQELYNKLENEIKNLQILKSSNTIDSVIIKDNNELNLIKEGIKKNFNKNIRKFDLLLRGSRNGFSVKDFHSKCDGKDYTITFVETNKGRRFGGFTEAKWDQSDTWKKGPKSFIFSLDNKEIYYNMNNRDSIYCYPNTSLHGLAFGKGHDFKLYDKCNENNESYDSSGNTFYTNGKTHALAGEGNFFVKDYEVYKIYLE